MPVRMVAPAPSNTDEQMQARLSDLVGNSLPKLFGLRAGCEDPYAPQRRQSPAPQPPSSRPARISAPFPSRLSSSGPWKHPAKLEFRLAESPLEHPLESIALKLPYQRSRHRDWKFEASGSNVAQYNELERYKMLQVIHLDQRDPKAG